MCLQENNTAFKEYKEKYPPPHKVPAEILFGPLDTLHEDRINAIHTHISNCVEFARDLMMLLEEHGNKLVKMYRKNAPSVVVPDITELGLPEYDPKFLETVKKRWRSS